MKKSLLKTTIKMTYIIELLCRKRRHKLIEIVIANKGSQEVSHYFLPFGMIKIIICIKGIVLANKLFIRLKIFIRIVI